MAKKVKGQLSFNDMFEDLFPHSDDSVADFVRDVDCSMQTPESARQKRFRTFQGNLLAGSATTRRVR